MTKILICGDWHGSHEAARYAAKRATKLGCRIIVQVGDFGFWPHTSPGFVDTVNNHLAEAEIGLIWVDGNHENFDILFGTDWPKTKQGFWQIAEWVAYAPRGHRWEWDGVTFLSLGGGYSIDKEWRLSQGPEGMYWWRQETITQKNVIDCGRTPVDVMITHDMPQGTDLGIALTHNSREDQWNRKAVLAVVEAVKPKRLYHGHYHHRKTSLFRLAGAPPVKIESLDMWKGLPLDSHFAVLDLDQLKQRRTL